MNLYKISQSVNNGWDTYSDAVVAAEDEEQARHIHPYSENSPGYTEGGDEDDNWQWTHSWAAPEDVQVQLVGEAAPDIEAGVIVASFHAG